MPGASALELRMAVPGRALFCVALVRAQHTLSMLMQAFSTAQMMWISGFYGYSGTPDTPAETFAERVVIREVDCTCLQMSSPPSPGADRRVTHRGHENLRYRG